MFVSFTDKNRHSLKAEMHNVSAPHLFIQTDDTDGEGEWLNYVIIYARISFSFDWQMVGI